MFSTLANHPHSARKRHLSNIYSKSTILSSSPLQFQSASIIHTRLLPALFAAMDSPEPGVINIYNLFSATTMDIVSGYIFGLSSGTNFLQSPDTLAWFLHVYRCRHGFSFFPQELPGLTAMMPRWVREKIVPKFVDEANGEIEEWIVGMCEKAGKVVRRRERGEEVSEKDVPVVYAQLLAGLERERKKNGKDNDNMEMTKVVASELMDQLTAGFDTSGIVLTYVVHELCRHPSVQKALHTELLTLSPPVVPSSHPKLPDAKAVDNLPLLHAVIWETLRLHPAIPGPQPRVTPTAGCRLGPEGNSYWIPGGVRVSASAGLLHANEDVFERADEWRPERWLEGEKGDERKEMDRWFWAFG